MREMVTAIRVASNEKDEGGKVIVMVTRVASERRQWQQRGIVVMAKRVAGKDEGDGKGGKSNGDGDKEGNCE